MKKIDNYFDAVHYLDNDFILCNNIGEVDEEYYYCDTLGPWYDEDDEDYYPEIYQTFLTDCSDEDARYLSERFGLLFQYSPKLELWCLCVPHFGTMWKGVHVEDNLENMQ